MHALPLPLIPSTIPLLISFWVEPIDYHEIMTSFRGNIFDFILGSGAAAGTLTPDPCRVKAVL